jgi:hypothetical protein
MSSFISDGSSCAIFKLGNVYFYQVPPCCRNITASHCTRFARADRLRERNEIFTALNVISVLSYEIADEIVRILFVCVCMCVCVRVCACVCV